MNGPQTNNKTAQIHEEPTVIAMQQHMAQQAAFQSIPDPVKMVRWAAIGFIHFVHSR